MVGQGDVGAASPSSTGRAPSTPPPYAARVPQPVVLVPGLGLTAREWRGVRALLDGASAVVPLPSMGLGALRGTDLSVEAQADRVAALLPLAPAVVVGHSASCPVVVEVARRVRVAGLVLVGPVTDPRAATWPRMVAQSLRTARHERPWEAPALVPQYARTGAASMRRGMTVVRRYRTDHALADVDVPVEVVRGERDRIAPSDWCRTLSPHVTTVAGAGHMVPLTHPQAVADAVRRVAARGQDAPRSS